MAQHVTHGLARTYWRGCRCLRCRAASAVYHQQSRWLAAHGTGRRVSARLARRVIRLLEVEGWTRGRIAQELGRKWPVLRVGVRFVRAQTLARLRRLLETE